MGEGGVKMNTEKSDEAFWSSNSDLDVFKNICFVDEFLFGDITSFSKQTSTVSSF